MKKLKPAHPGKLLLAEFIKPMNLTVYRVAKDSGIPQSTLAGRGKRPALHLGRDGDAIGPLLRHGRSILAEPSNALRPYDVGRQKEPDRKGSASVAKGGLTLDLDCAVFRLLTSASTILLKRAVAGLKVS